jgi:hypothetical protein
MKLSRVIGMVLTETQLEDIARLCKGKSVAVTESDPDVAGLVNPVCISNGQEAEQEEGWSRARCNGHRGGL